MSCQVSLMPVPLKLARSWKNRGVMQQAFFVNSLWTVLAAEMTFLVISPYFSLRTCCSVFWHLHAIKMKGKMLIFLILREEAVSDMAILKGSSVLLPHGTFYCCGGCGSACGSNVVSPALKLGQMKTLICYFDPGCIWEELKNLLQ